MQAGNNYIAGEWVGAAETIERRNPSDTDELVGIYACAGLSDVDAAVCAARQAQPAWADTGEQERADILERIAAAILVQREQLAALLSREEGKTLAESRGEIEFSASVFKFYAGEAVRMAGRAGRSLRAGAEVEVRHEPLGVVALITPWNFPFCIPAWKAAPALAYGNCVILKPSELTNGSAHALTKIIHDAGLPKGVFQLLMGAGGKIGGSLARHPDIDGISFTGSVATGRAISEQLRSQRTRIQLEMGGKNPLVVMADANIDAAVDVAIRGAFFATGQRCTASSRIILQDAVHDEFVERMKRRMRELRVGHALDPASQIGPLVSEAQLERVLRYMEIGRAEGSTLAAGGERMEAKTPGHYMSPTLFVDTTNVQTLNREEIFGPVAATIRARGFDEALAIANDTPMGLAASIFTSSLKHAIAFKRHSRAGIVGINMPTFGADYHAPFGGRGESGTGSREMGTYAREFYTTVKTVYIAP
jgi:alpha-ketoglutaric semialdehyde dehydrogenase